jgi:hypothetical protein
MLAGTACGGCPRSARPHPALGACAAGLCEPDCGLDRGRLLAPPFGEAKGGKAHMVNLHDHPPAWWVRERTCHRPEIVELRPRARRPVLRSAKDHDPPGAPPPAAGAAAAPCRTGAENGHHPPVQRRQDRGRDEGPATGPAAREDGLHGHRIHRVGPDPDRAHGRSDGMCACAAGPTSMAICTPPPCWTTCMW